MREDHALAARVGFVGLFSLLLPLAPAAAGKEPAEALADYRPPEAAEASDWPDDRLARFLVDLRNFVYDHHTVTDADRLIYGLTYEFYKDGKQIQAMGLDSMHDGAWFVDALLTAELAQPGKDHLERARRYQIPFYTNVANHSDELFPNMVNKSRQDRTPIEEPIKGWVPRGWDDGLGYDRLGNRYRSGDYRHADRGTIVRKDGEFRYCYDLPSNHLAQDLVNMYLDVWLTTRNGRAREAAKHVHRYRKEHFRSIPAIARSVEYMDGDSTYPSEPPGLRPKAARCYYGGLHRFQKRRVRTHNDNLGWAYRRATARHVVTGDVPPAFMWNVAWQVHAAAATTERFYDGRRWPAGFWLFHRVRVGTDEGTGKLNRYLSEGEGPARIGTRGIQLSALGAATLPMLRAHPEVWQRPHRQGHAGEPLVRMVDACPATDGEREGVYDGSAQLKRSDTRVAMVSDPKHLHLLVRSTRDRVRVAVEPAGSKQKGGKGIFEVRSTGEVTASNGDGEKLLSRSAFAAGDPWTAELRVPYTAVPPQARWINGVDHGRYDVTIGESTVTVYLLSKPERIIRRLERLALGTIDNWHEVWEDSGVLPGAIQSGSREPTPHWGTSELGGYAHLITTIAMVLLDRSGTSEWEALDERFPAEPRPAPTLPASVLDRLGLQRSGATDR